MIRISNDATRSRNLVVRAFGGSEFNEELMPAEEAMIWFTGDTESMHRGSVYADINIGDGYIELNFNDSIVGRPEVQLQRDRAARMVK
jgi:hypothetical protein